MLDTSRRNRVGLGLIGLGPSWEKIYGQTLVRLQHRLTIRLVYDPVQARAKSVASDLEASVANSLHQILTWPSLQGLLVLDGSWFGKGALQLFSQSDKPVYLARPLLQNIAALRDILNQGTLRAEAIPNHLTSDDRWMPELRFRFTPAACRLRELIATKLGAAKQIQIECNLSGEPLEIAELVDWCIDIMGQSPLPPSTITNPSRLLLVFSGLAPSSVQRTAELRQSDAVHRPLQFQVECEHGHATLFERTCIAWQTEDESANESLMEERTEFEILIDQFCRRAVGGLNPIGRLREFMQAAEIVESIRNRP